MTGKDDQYTCNTLAKLMQNNNIINNISFVLHSLMNFTLIINPQVQTYKLSNIRSYIHSCMHAYAHTSEKQELKKL